LEWTVSVITPILPQTRREPTPGAKPLDRKAIAWHYRAAIIAD
jgi:hypothetical protein